MLFRSHFDPQVKGAEMPPEFSLGFRGDLEHRGIAALRRRNMERLDVLDFLDGCKPRAPFDLEGYLPDEGVPGLGRNEDGPLSHRGGSE